MANAGRKIPGISRVEALIGAGIKRGFLKINRQRLKVI